MSWLILLMIVLGVAAGAITAKPGIVLVVRHRRLRDGRHVRQLRHALGRIDRDRLDLVGLAQVFRRRDRREIHLDVAAHDRRDGLRRAAERHVLEVDIGLLAEDLGRQERRAGDAGLTRS